MLTQKSIRAKLQELALMGDQENYYKLLSAIRTLWVVGVIDQRLYTAALQEDDRIFNSGEADVLCDGTFDSELLSTVYGEW